jgi:cysteine desulfurase/selenocysteine lyase
MSTSNSPSGAGPVDLDALARLANEYFSEWTGAGKPAPATPLPQTAGFERYGASPRAVDLPGAAELRELLASLEFIPAGLAAERVPPTPESVRAPFDVNLIRRDFPILAERVNGRPLVWLDNAATTQKPRAVIDRLKYFYEHENSNVHRAAHELAARATDAYEGAREKVRGFLNAASAKEIVFVRGATEAINLVAQSWGRQNVGKGDEIVVTWLEHHANIVPWQQLAEEKGARLRVAPVDDSGQILLEEYGQLLGPKTRLVSFPQVSNALGTITPARQMVEMAHSAGQKFWWTARSRFRICGRTCRR